MLLLDHNLSHQLRDLLAEYGLEAETTRFRKWEQLRNGDLVAAAYIAGFEAIFHTRQQVRGIRLDIVITTSIDGIGRDWTPATKLESLQRCISSGMAIGTCHSTTGKSGSLALKATAMMAGLFGTDSS